MFFFKYMLFVNIFLNFKEKLIFVSIILLESTNYVYSV